MSQEPTSLDGLVCPVPLVHQEQIIIGHGSGGKLSHDLIKKVFLPQFSNPILNIGDDAGVVNFSVKGGLESLTFNRLAISTDSHVVSPLFFAGGDIGRLAVCGTVNDVAMMGARPIYLTAGFILEEGLEVETLNQVLRSMHKAAIEAEVEIIAGDTKVVQKGKADGMYINTTGVGVIQPGIEISGMNAKDGDVVILSGPLAAHGMAVLEAREELGFSSNIQSDVAPLNHLIRDILKVSQDVHVLRDPTRGGLATTLNEIAQQSNVCIVLNEDKILVRPEVAAACELLGFDPLYVANEGVVVAFVSEREAAKIIDAMRGNQYGKHTAAIGIVQSKPAQRVLLKTALGSTRMVDMPSGELLPRIC